MSLHQGLPISSSACWKCACIGVLVVCAALFGCNGEPAPSTEPNPDRSIRAEALDRDGRVTATTANASDPANAAPSRPARPGDWFETMSSTGVDFAYRNGEQAGLTFLIESLGGGAAMVDFDRDGDLDLFFTGGGSLDKETRRVNGRAGALFRNEGAWQFTPVTEPARLAASELYTHGCSVCDYDIDGFPDLLICGYGGVQLFRNQGDGTFEDVAKRTGLTADGWCTASAWADIDHDGDNDLFLIRYVVWSPEIDRPCHTAEGFPEVCTPNQYEPARQSLYLNRGDGTFEDVSAARGITGTGNGLAVVAADFDQDGWCDFYVANDGKENQLYLGKPDGTFTEAGHSAGVATDEYGKNPASMGVDVGDYDGDGRPDFFVTNFEREDDVLYRNLGNRQFVQTTTQTGMAGPTRLQVGFGTAMTDFDSDGWPDLFIANGHVFYRGGLTTYRQPPQLFRNHQGKRFEEASNAAGEYFERKHAGRGVAVGDLDDDGAPDIVVVHQNAPVTLLRNLKAPKRFVRLRLRGTNSNVEAIGASVTVRDGTRDLTRWICSGCGYFSQFDLRPIVPLNDSAGSVTAIVRWPGGTSEQFSSLDPNRSHELVEGRGEPTAP